METQNAVNEKSEMKSTIGSKIASLRKARGLTQADIGTMLNISYQAVSKWERDESCPDFDTLSKLAQFFGVPISFFEKSGEAAVETAATAVAAPVASAEIEEKKMLGVCRSCGKVVYEGEAALTSPELICKPCHTRRINKEKAEQKAKIEAAKRAEEQKKKAIEEQKQMRRAQIARDRNRGLIWGGIVSVLCLAIGVWLFGWEVAWKGLLFDVFVFSFVAQMFWNGAVFNLATFGGKVIGTPGVIFEFSLDGFIFLIAMKLLFALLRLVVYVASLLFFVVLALIISPFTFVPALLRVQAGHIDDTYGDMIEEGAKKIFSKK